MNLNRITERIGLVAAIALMAAPLPAAQILIPGQVAMGDLSQGDAVGQRGGYEDTFTFVGLQGQTIGIRLESSEIDSYLRVVTPGGMTLTDDDSGGGVNSMINAVLTESGQFQVYPTSYGAGETGSYRLTLNITGGDAQAAFGQTTQPTTAPATTQPSTTITLPTTAPTTVPSGFGAPLPTGGAISVGQTLPGELAMTDQTQPTGERMDRWTLQGQPGQVVTIRMDSPTVDTYLILNGPDGMEIDRDDDSGGELNAMIVATLNQPGLHEIVATTFASGVTGPYTLSVTEGAAPVPDPWGGLTGGGVGGSTSIQQNVEGPPTGSGQQMTVGQTVNGDLSFGDTTLDDTGEYFDRYSFYATAGQAVEIRLDATAFDPYLIFRTPNSTQYDNDDGDQGFNSRIVASLDQTGQYDVMATSFQPGETGSYVLRVTPYEMPPNTPGGPIAVGQTVNGWLGPGDGQMDTGAYRDDHTLQVTPGQQITIDLNSSDFDTLLTFVDPAGQSQDNDDYGGSLNSRLDVATATPGLSTVRVTSYGSGAVGAYTLTVRPGGPDWGQQPATPDFGDFGNMLNRDASSVQARGNISQGQSINDQLGFGDQQLANGAWADAFTFYGQQGQQVSISLSSGAVDTYLILRHPSGQQTEDDDGAGFGTNSLIRTALPETGNYTIICTAFSSDESGAYTLNVQ